MKLYRQPGSRNWFVTLSVDGRRIRRTLRTKDRKLAHLRARLLMNESLPHLAARDITIEDFEHEYLQWVPSRKSAGTLRSEKNAIKRLRLWRPGARLNRLAAKDVDAFVSMLVADEVQPASVNYYLRTLRSIFATALRWEYVAENVFHKVKLLRYEKPQPRALSLEEVRAFQTWLHEHSPELVQLVDFYLLTGARRSEALNLAWENVDFDHRLVRFVKTKGQRIREIPMTSRVYQLLRSRRNLSRPFPFSESDVTRKITAALKAAGISNATLHDLRRSFASHLSRLGMPDFLLMPLVGHMDRETTQAHYIATFDKSMRTHLNRLERTLYKVKKL